MPYGSQEEPPLPAHIFLVLLVLNAESTHGYGIKQAVAERDSGAPIADGVSRPLAPFGD